MSVIAANNQCYPSFDWLYDSLEEAEAVYTGDELFEDQTFYGLDALRPSKLKQNQRDAISTAEQSAQLYNDYGELDLWYRPSHKDGENYSLWGVPF